MIYLIDISNDVLRIVNIPDIIALAARVLLLSIVLCTRVAIFFVFFVAIKTIHDNILETHNNNQQRNNMNQYDNNDIDINEDPNIEMHQQKPLSDEDIDAMYQQHLNDNNNQ